MAYVAILLDSFDLRLHMILYVGAYAQRYVCT